MEIKATAGLGGSSGEKMVKRKAMECCIDLLIDETLANDQRDGPGCDLSKTS